MSVSISPNRVSVLNLYVYGPDFNHLPVHARNAKIGAIPLISRITVAFCKQLLGIVDVPRPSRG